MISTYKYHCMKPVGGAWKYTGNILEYHEYERRYSLKNNTTSEKELVRQNLKEILLSDDLALDLRGLDFVSEDVSKVYGSITGGIIRKFDKMNKSTSDDSGLFLARVDIDRGTADMLFKSKPRDNKVLSPVREVSILSLIEVNRSSSDKVIQDLVDTLTELISDKTYYKDFLLYEEYITSLSIGSSEIDTPESLSSNILISNDYGELLHDTGLFNQTPYERDLRQFNGIPSRILSFYTAFGKTVLFCKLRPDQVKLLTDLSVFDFGFGLVDFDNALDLIVNLWVEDSKRIGDTENYVPLIVRKFREIRLYGEAAEASIFLYTLYLSSSDKEKFSLIKLYKNVDADTEEDSISIKELFEYIDEHGSTDIITIVIDVLSKLVGMSITRAPKEEIRNEVSHKVQNLRDTSRQFISEVFQA